MGCSYCSGSDPVFTLAGKQAVPSGLVPAGDAALPARLSRSTWKDLGTLHLHQVIFLKAELSMGPQELLQHVQFTRLGFNTFSVASCISVAF